MGYRKSTLRRLPPITRKYARLLGELDSAVHRGKNLVEEFSRPEFESQALARAKEPTSEETIFVLTREDVIECAREIDIPEEAITDDILRLVRKGVDSGLGCWSDVVKEAIDFALKS